MNPAAIHEAGHCVAALVVGDAVRYVQVNVDGSGKTVVRHRSAFSKAVVASAGALAEAKLFGGYKPYDSLASTLVDAYWDHIVALADALEECGYLSGDQLLQAINDGELI